MPLRTPHAAEVAPEAIGPATSAREAITAALGTVSGLTVHPTAPDNPVAFDAFPRWAQTSYQRGKLGWLAVHEYDARIVLPAGYEPDTVTTGDSLLDRVATALYRVGTVTTAEPIVLVFRNGVELPALSLRVTPRPTPQTTP